MVHFGFIPVAEASVATLMKSINRVIINPLIFFLFALALAYFLYGVAQYLLNPDNEEINKKSKTQMLTGIVGLFIMVAVFGIMNLILHTIGEKNIRIENTGNYVITKNQKDFGKFNTASKDLNPTSSNLTSGSIDIRSAENIDLTNVKTTKIVDFESSPFRVKYLPSSYCWHEVIYAKGNIEYASLKKVKDQAQKDLGMNVKPLIFGLLTAYNPQNKTYYSWIDARYPINGGTDNDCVLKVDAQKTKALPYKDYVSGHPFSVPTDMSDGPSIFTQSYNSDALFTRVVASGISPILELAREIALKNAFRLLGIKIQDINSMTIVYPPASILNEKYVYNPRTGDYNYWVALQSKKK